MSRRIEIEFSLNGRPARASVRAPDSALKLLREEFELTGVKYACGEGECGACTILLDGVSANACLLFAAELDGRAVKTVEGVQTEGVMNALQSAFVEKGAVQCGFCTPGMVMQASHVLERYPNASNAEVRRHLEGNVCRCTGYTKIVDAVVKAASGAK